PGSQSEYVDDKLETEMQIVIDIVSLGRAARNDCQIKIRQPLSRIFLPAKVKSVVDRMEDLIKEEINIHHIEYISEEDGFVQYELKPDFKVMGPKYGKLMKPISDELKHLKGQEVLQAFEAGLSYELKLGTEVISLVSEDLSVQILPREGVIFETVKDVFVALDTHLTPDLLCEGYARELVNKIQYTRKEQGFEIMDRIRIEWLGDEEIDAAFFRFRDYICAETLCDKITRMAELTGEMMQYDVNGKEVWMKVSR
ncbi:MAG: DUF5915 domain-containing protein, partial [Candidatus Cloacimonetes bacterium]|nr:DUF5915 domain-containing protein [Candidatus Cloacimonadota bacterium]